MKGIQKETEEYVLMADRENLPEDQTTWIIKLFTKQDDIKHTTRLSNTAMKENARKELKMVEEGFGKVEEIKFRDAVKGFRNYTFGYQFPDLQENGPMDSDDPAIIAKVFYDLSPADQTELIKVASGDIKIDSSLNIDKKK